MNDIELSEKIKKEAAGFIDIADLKLDDGIIKRLNRIYEKVPQEEKPVVSGIILPRGIRDAEGALDTSCLLIDCWLSGKPLIPETPLYFMGLSLIEYLLKQYGKTTK